MGAPIADDEFWKLIEPLLPVVKPRAKSDPARPSVPDRAALNGILFVLRTGIRWNHCLTYYCKSGMCHRCLHMQTALAGQSSANSLLSLITAGTSSR